MKNQANDWKLENGGEGAGTETSSLYSSFAGPVFPSHVFPPDVIRIFTDVNWIELSRPKTGDAAS